MRLENWTARLTVTVGSLRRPDDATRVKLVDVGPEVGADYINANYINGEADGTQRRYIAAQGTMPDTLAAFWQMIFENNCALWGRTGH